MNTPTLDVIEYKHPKKKGKPNYEYVKLWLNNLKSGDYQPNGNAWLLRTIKGHSALGVLVDILVSKKKTQWYKSPFGEQYYCIPVDFEDQNSPFTHERLGQKLRDITNIDFDTETFIIKLENDSEFTYAHVITWLETLYPPINIGPSGPGGGSLPVSAAA